MIFGKNKTYIIAEVAQAHEGSLGIAHSYIDAAASAGVDAVKFQTHFAEFESSQSENFRIKVKYSQDMSRFDYWRRMEFTRDQWLGLKMHCDELGVDFISSAFSIEAFKLLEDIKVPLWKVPSGEVQNLQLIKLIAETKKPILISSGMSSFLELDQAINLIKNNHDKFIVMQCTSTYPCPPELIGMNMLQVFKNRYFCDVGLSDHSGTIFPALTAVSLGAKVIEVHISFNKKMFGYDASSSISIEQLKILVEGIRFTDKMLSSPVDKDYQSLLLADVKNLFQKSIYVRNKIEAGEKICEDSLILKKPGDGILASSMDKILGKKATILLEPGHLLRWGDME
jgi:N,N'-diacetyllegionaminate synthase